MDAQDDDAEEDELELDAEGERDSQATTNISDDKVAAATIFTLLERKTLQRVIYYCQKPPFFSIPKIPTPQNSQFWCFLKMPRYWKISRFLLLLGALPPASSKAISNSEIEIIHEIPNPPPPNRIRNTQPKRLLQFDPRDELNGQSITRRGQCGSKGKDDQWEDCESGPVVTVEVEVCEYPPIDDPDSCTVELIPNWARGPWRQPRSFEFMTARGKRGLALVADPKEDKDFLPRLEENYSVTNLNPEDRGRTGVGEDVPLLSFYQTYGFQESGVWRGVWIHSKGGHYSAVVKISIGRSSPGHDGKSYVAIVAHSIFSTRDANRYVHGTDGFLKLDENFNIVPLPVAEVAAKAIPVSQLVYFAAKQTDLLDGEAPPEKYFLVLDTVENPDAKRVLEVVAISLRHNVVDPDIVLRADAAGVEGEMFTLVAGTDPVYLWLNTIGRNPDTFGRYKISSFKIRKALSYPSWMITIELVKK
ncbi:hypothetical protein HYFRA_00005409 [Hymenoscyphus fraxineus]|uniref:Uncharacterized protein n=1 Tax=Hymenoscyphus fraxineus TaxID=746836 RepID=A0A9N9KQH2_9HELO|nr:hypothetical protein HYFRA_00005409 [Hymenoscyphus fraxineus]